VAARLTAETDERLAALVIADRSDDASTELFRRYRKRVYLWCFRYAHDADEALDLTQEIFVRIFRGIDGFAGRARFSTWVYRIAQNHCLSAMARRRDAWRQRRDDGEGPEVADHRDAERQREADLSGDVDALLARAAARMEEDELQAFVLHYRDGLTVGEITRMMGCANTTGARTLIQNARRKFRRLAAQRGMRDG
jgi:RNA polymerase sigma-70 factor (ECF subfamily)